MENTAPAETKAFAPFTHTFICPDCNRPLMLYVHSVHLKETVNCPRCSRTLTAIIRREIKSRTGV